MRGANFFANIGTYALVMSDCLIAAQKSNAKHNKSVGRIPEVRQNRLLSFEQLKVGEKQENSVLSTYILF